MSSGFIFIFDLIGTVIFAVTGAVSGVKLKLDLFGVVVFGCTVGVGGGILRDVIIDAVPVAALGNESYLVSCIVTGLVVFFLFPRIGHYHEIILICDAFGLGVFTALGAAKGMQYGLGPAGQVLCGVLSAVGGGVLRDVMAQKIPAVLVNDFYATAALIGGIIHVLLYRFMHHPGICFLIVACTVIVIRLVAAYCHLQLPHPAADEPGDKS